MHEDKIEEILNSILNKRFNINFEKNKELKGEKLLGLEINGQERELLLALIDIEESFKIKIDNGRILDGDFDTFNNIKNLIENSLISTVKDEIKG